MKIINKIFGGAVRAVSLILVLGMVLCTLAVIAAEETQNTDTLTTPPSSTEKIMHCQKDLFTLSGFFAPIF